MKLLLPTLALFALTSCSLLKGEGTEPHGDGSVPPGYQDPTPPDPYDKTDHEIATAMLMNNASQPFNPFYTGIGATLAAAAAAWGAYKHGLKKPAPNTGSPVVGPPA